MAKQTGLLRFTGKLGNLIFYQRQGNYFVRSMPGTVQQTAATKQAARNFGIASRKAKLIRQAILPHLDLRYEGVLVNRLNKALLRANGDIPTSIKGFQINSHKETAQFFCIQPMVTPQGTLKIPAQILPPQTNATHLEVKMIAVRVSFLERRITGSTTATTLVNLHQPFNGASLEANPPGKGTLLVVLQVRTFNGSIAMENRRSYAAAILAAITPPASKQRPLKANNIPDVKKLLPPQPATSRANTPRQVALHQRE